MDRIDLLESKVKQMIDLVQSLRDDNQALTERLAAAEARYRDLAREREVLDQERGAVRDRIEALLGDLADVEGAAARASGGPDPEGAGRPDPAPRRSDNPVLPGLA